MTAAGLGPHSMFPGWAPQQQPGWPAHMSASSTNTPLALFRCHRFCGDCGMVFEVEAGSAVDAESGARAWLSGHGARCDASSPQAPKPGPQWSDYAVRPE